MKRIQRKRTKGWKMPPNTVYVGRPTRWGNPYFIAPKGQFTREQAIETYENYVKRVLVDHPDFLEPLKGKDLACWCPLDKPCHADVLLKFLKQGKYGEAPKETEEWLKQAMHDYDLTREEAEKWYNDEDALNL
jgi:hypothetical protein